MADDRLSRLIELRDKLYSAIQKCESKRDLAALSRQYRETLREIDEIEGGPKEDDELGALLAQRRSDGRPSSVR